MTLVLRALVTGPARRRPLRFALPIAGVAIGVAAVAAIHHANRSVTLSFRESARALAGGSDLVVEAAGGVPFAEMERLRFLWEIGSFAPLVSGHAVLANGSGEVALLLGTDFAGGSSAREMRLALPATGGERARKLLTGTLLVPRPFAARHRLKAGSRLPLVLSGRRVEMVVGGILELSGLARAAGGDVLVTDVFTAGRLLGRPGVADRVDVTLDPDAERGEILREIGRRLPAGFRVEPASRGEESAEKMGRAFRFNLNALGSLTLFVGMFLVANAISVSVVRRRPEIATLRAIGASRGTVFVAFVVEGLGVGAAGTAVGLIAGRVLAEAALAAVSGTISTVYSSTAKVSAAGFGTAAALAAAVGVASTLVAALVPAAEATRVPPSPAMRPGSTEAVRRRRAAPRAIGASASLALAAVLAFGRPIAGFPWLGFGAVALVVLALALAAPTLVAAGSVVARRPLEKLFGASGRLGARFFGGSVGRNALAATALAMALGLTLAMVTTVASMRKTVRSWVGSTLRADLWIKSAAGRSGGIVGDLPPEIVRVLESIAGVEAVDPFRSSEAVDPRGRTHTVAASDFRVLARAGGAPLAEGGDARTAAEAARRSGAVFVSEPYARRYAVGPGGVATVSTARGLRSFPVAGVYRDFSDERGTVLFDRALYVELFDDRRLTSVAVVAEPGVVPEVLARRIRARLLTDWSVDVTSTRALRAEVLRIFDRTFALTRALEAIAVAVAVLGIANALAAAAVERRRSFGLLRAIGASQRQIHGAVLLEAFLVGAVATAAAAAAAAAFAAILILVINPQSFGWSFVPAVPAARLAGIAGAVLAASVAAGVVPGRLAAAADPAAALAEE